MKKPHTNKTKRTFTLGHKFHEWMDRGMDDALWGFRGDIIRIVPFQIVAFPELFEGTPHEGVLGTPDHILFFPLESVLIIVDGKSSSGFSFGKVRKEGTQAHHGIQTGTYYDGLLRSPLKHLVKKCAVYIAHMAKDHGEPRLTHVDGLKISSAQDYWEAVALAYRRCLDTGNIPGEVKPMTKWACNYCDFFSDWDQCSKCTTLDIAKEVFSERDA